MIRYFCATHTRQRVLRRGGRSFAKSSPNLDTLSASDYSRQTPREHVLLRPQMYVGSNELTAPTSGVRSWDFRDQVVTRIDSKQEEFSPALLKVFDELLVNAADNSVRDSSCRNIQVEIDPKKPSIRVRNDGQGLPVELHPTEGIYVPELIFGHLLTGSNFDDTSGRLTGGRHGYGAKLANILSHKFTVETADWNRKLRYKQTWEQNMSIARDPKISPNHGKGFTEVSIVPDLVHLIAEGDVARSSLTEIDTGNLAALHRRVVDVAGCLATRGVKVSLNGQKIQLKSFKDYALLFAKAELGGQSHNEKIDNKEKSKKSAPLKSPTCYYEKMGDWEVAVLPASSFLDFSEGSQTMNPADENESVEKTVGGKHISFVNAVHTSQGGSHANHVSSVISKEIAAILNKKYPDLGITPQQVKSDIVFFINVAVENPTFDSQSKECLTTKTSQYCRQKDRNNMLFQPSRTKLAQFVLTTDLEQTIINKALTRKILMQKRLEGKANKSSSSSSSIRVNFPKLEDAYYAGRSGSRADQKPCTLILTEGDSAKALAVAGLELIGRDFYGVYPLRGKFLNVREASNTQLRNNKAIVDLCKIIGLDFNKKYVNGPDKQMRYQRVMIMADQDIDGSHIKGLLINFFHHFWPNLLKYPDFFQQFATPVLKASKKGKPKEVLSFYSIPEYEKWKETCDPNQWSIKYYKGLGTSTMAEAKEYFRQLEKHRSSFKWTESVCSDDAVENRADNDSTGELIDMVFNKKRAEDRRKWLLANCSPEPLKPNLPHITYSDFINQELVNFSHADNIRSLPSVIDGLKPSQRKLLYACFKRDLKDEIKVAQLAGYCAEHTAYHHGEASMQSVIVSMAQDFVGSNNLPLLQSSGMFGTRLEGGKDAASPRYIFTKLNDFVRTLFPKTDDDLLEYLEDDGQSVEPRYYAPIIPLVLVNGIQGIGTGWSTSIPPHNPLQIIQKVKQRLVKKKDNDIPMIPWFKGFVGNVLAEDPLQSETMELANDPSKYFTTGIVNVLSDTQLEITELPVGKWTNEYKSFLLRLVELGTITDFKELHTAQTPHFLVTMPKKMLKEMSKNGPNSLLQHLKLVSGVSVSNMVAFSESGSIMKFSTPDEIMEHFFTVRYNLYSRRKDRDEKMLATKTRFLDEKMRFIRYVLSGEVDLTSGQSSKQIEQQLLKLGFSGNAQRNEDLTSYLLSLPIRTFTEENVDKAQRERNDVVEALVKLEEKSVEQLWLDDLKAFEDVLTLRKRKEKKN